MPAIAFSLTDDGVWQRDGVALLDFEDGSGSCETGSYETNRSLRGEAPSHDDYTGVAFTLGIPERRNHLDAATAPAPFNAPLYRDLDLTQTQDFQADLVPGCMAFAGVPECPAMFGAFAIKFEGEPRRTPKQAAFQLQ